MCNAHGFAPDKSGKERVAEAIIGTRRNGGGRSRTRSRSSGIFIRAHTRGENYINRLSVKKSPTISPTLPYAAKEERDVRWRALDSLQPARSGVSKLSQSGTVPCVRRKHRKYSKYSGEVKV